MLPSIYIIPHAIIGVFGLVNLPVLWLNSFIYSITLFYGFTWLLNRGIESHHVWADRGLLILGGYIAGISLTGAPLMVAVYMRNVTPLFLVVFVNKTKSIKSPYCDLEARLRM
jgi:uncharacterized protein